jgi:gas vesicle protein
MDNVKNALNLYREVASPNRREPTRREADNEFTNVEIENLEDMEQSLIQHIRVCGLNKSRECSLIDEILEIRKKRRQLVKILHNESTQLRNECGMLHSQLISAKERHEEKIKNKNQTFQLAMEEKNHEIMRLKEHLMSVNDVKEVQYKQIMSNEISKLKEKYANNLNELESKINQLQNTSLESQNNVAKEYVEEIVKSLNSKHKKNMKK